MEAERSREVRRSDNTLTVSSEQLPNFYEEDTIIDPSLCGKGGHTLHMLPYTSNAFTVESRSRWPSSVLYYINNGSHKSQIGGEKLF